MTARQCVAAAVLLVAVTVAGCEGQTTAAPKPVQCATLAGARYTPGEVCDDGAIAITAPSVERCVAYYRLLDGRLLWTPLEPTSDSSLNGVWTLEPAAVAVILTPAAWADRIGC